MRPVTHIHTHTHTHTCTKPKPTKYLRDWRQGWCPASVPVKEACCLVVCSRLPLLLLLAVVTKGRQCFIIVVSVSSWWLAGYRTSEEGGGPNHALFSNTPLLKLLFTLAIVSGGVRRDVLRVITDCCFAQSREAFYLACHVRGLRRRAHFLCCK